MMRDPKQKRSKDAPLPEPIEAPESPFEPPKFLRGTRIGRSVPPHEQTGGGAHMPPGRRLKPWVKLALGLSLVAGVSILGEIGRHEEPKPPRMVELSGEVENARHRDILQTFSGLFGGRLAFLENGMRFTFDAEEMTRDDIVSTVAKKAGFDKALYDAFNSRYRIPDFWNFAVMTWESRLNPNAVHRNDDGTQDEGLNQLNNGYGPKMLALMAMDLIRAGEGDLLGRVIPSSGVRKLAGIVNEYEALDARSRSLQKHELDQLPGIRGEMDAKMDELVESAGQYYRPFDPDQNAAIGLWVQRDHLNRLDGLIGTNRLPDTEQREFMSMMHYTGWERLEGAVKTAKATEGGWARVPVVNSRGTTSMVYRWQTAGFVRRFLPEENREPSEYHDGACRTFDELMTGMRANP